MPREPLEPNAGPRSPSPTDDLPCDPQQPAFPGRRHVPRRRPGGEPASPQSAVTSPHRNHQQRVSSSPESAAGRLVGTPHALDHNWSPSHGPPHSPGDVSGDENEQWEEWQQLRAESHLWQHRRMS